MIGWQGGRTANAAPGVQEGLSSSVVLIDPAAVLGGQLWLLLEISTTWLLLSNPDIHSSQPLTVVCAPWVHAGWLCVIHFLPPLPPATTQPREPHSPIKEGSHWPAALCLCGKHSLSLKWLLSCKGVMKTKVHALGCLFLPSSMLWLEGQVLFEWLTIFPISACLWGAQNCSASQSGCQQIPPCQSWMHHGTNTRMHQHQDNYARQVFSQSLAQHQPWWRCSWAWAKALSLPRGKRKMHIPASMEMEGCEGWDTFSALRSRVAQLTQALQALPLAPRLTTPVLPTPSDSTAASWSGWVRVKHLQSFQRHSLLSSVSLNI